MSDGYSRGPYRSVRERLARAEALAKAERAVVEAAMEWKAGDPRTEDPDARALRDACAALAALQKGKKS